MRLLVLALIVVFAASTVRAVIHVDFPMRKIYDLSTLVLIGKVAHIDPAEKAVEVQIVKVSKGDFAGKSVKIQLATVNDYVGRVKVDEPVVIFSGLKTALVHLADNFLNAEPLVAGASSRCNVTALNPITPRFPGRTLALVRLVDEIASGDPTLLNIIEHVVWNGGIRNWGKVLPNADYIVAADFNGGGKADVIIGNEHSTELLLNTGNGFKDETTKWGLRHAHGKWAASGDINGDGRVDLLIGQQIWLNKDRHFVPGPVLSISNDADVLAVALLDATSNHGHPDAMFLKRDGELLVFKNPGRDDAPWTKMPSRHLWNDGENAEAAAFSSDWGDTGKPHVMVVRASGLTRYALDPDGGPPADFERLTGQTLKAYNEIEQSPRWNVMAAVPLDINGDGHEDLIVILDKGGPTLVNRGFGTFFLNPLPADTLDPAPGREVPWTIAPNTRFGAGDIHGDKFDDLLIVTSDGKLFELDNTPYERMPNRFQ